MRKEKKYGGIEVSIPNVDFSIGEDGMTINFECPISDMGNFIEFEAPIAKNGELHDGWLVQLEKTTAVIGLPFFKGKYYKISVGGEYLGDIKESEIKDSLIKILTI